MSAYEYRWEDQGPKGEVMNPEFVPVHLAILEYVRERDSGPAGYIFEHKVLPAIDAWRAAREAR